MDVVLPTPPFWLAIVMTRIRFGAGKGSWSAACSTRVARIASIAMGLSKSAMPWTSGRRLISGEAAAQPLARVGHRGSFLHAFTCMAVSRGSAFRVPVSQAPVSRGTGRVAVAVPRGTGARPVGAAGARRHRAPRVMTTTVVAASPEPGTDSPRMHVPHAGGLEFGHQGGQFRERAARPRGRPTGRPGRISPRHQPTRRGSGATARAVTTSTGPDGLGDRPLLGAAAHDPPAQSGRLGEARRRPPRGTRPGGPSAPPASGRRPAGRSPAGSPAVRRRCRRPRRGHPPARPRRSRRC